MNRKFNSIAFWVFIMMGLYTCLNAQTLKHSYTFEDGTYNTTTKVINDQVGTVNGTIVGQGLVFKNGAVINTYGQRSENGYITFDGAALALNTYSAVTLEFYLTTTNDAAVNHWAVLAYFGGAAGATSICTNVVTGTGNSRIILNNAVTASSTKADANTTHHYVGTIVPSTETTAGSITWYIDGVQAGTSSLAANTYNNAISGITTTNAMLFRSAWNDPNWTGKLHEFNIYDGAMDAATVLARSKMYNFQLSALTFSAGTLKPDFASGIYNYALTIPAGTANLDITATPGISGKTVLGTGSHDVSGENGTITVKIDSASAFPYTIYWSKPIATAELKHSYTFADGTAKDVIGSANGTLVGTKNAIANGAYTATAGGKLSDGASNHIVLPVKNIALSQYPSFTMETYALTKTSGFISYFGGQAGWGVDYLFVQNNGTDLSCNYYWEPWRGTTNVSAGTNADGIGHHLVTVVTNDTMYVYRDGKLNDKKVLGTTNKSFNIKNDTAYIGRGGYITDNNYVGSVSEYNIYKGALDSATIRTRSEAYHNSDAFLTGLTLSKGTLSPAFSLASTNYTGIMPKGTTSVLLGATVSNTLATVADTGTVDVSSGNVTRNVVVTAPDGVTKTTSTINFRFASTDSLLSDLTVNGTTVAGFASNVHTYNVVLDGSAPVPTVVGTPNFSGAKVVVTPATLIPGATTILVTAEDGIAKTTYTINFTYKDPTIVTNKAGLIMEDFSPKDSITVSGANLLADITITAPAGITVILASIPKASASNVKVYVNYDGITIVNDSIILTSGTVVKKVGIKTFSNAGCFKPLYATGNLISNPYFSSLNGYSGWGSREITTNADEVNCGRGSYKTSGDCGGSLDYSLNGKVEANTAYRLKAMVKTTGKFKFIINGMKVNGSDNYYLDVNTGGVWQPAVYSFVSGATMSANQNLYFNSCEGYAGTLAFLDNYELYKLPLYVTPSSLTFLGSSTLDVTIKAQTLSDSVVVTTPAGFSVPKAKMSPIGDYTLSITFDGVAATNGYVYLTSGTNKDSVLVTGTVEPSLVVSPSAIGLDELNPKDSIVVNGGNLTNDITLTAPAGLILNPSTISAANAKNVKVIVTYDGTSSITGNITLTSGTIEKTVAVKAGMNSSCFTSEGINLVADPYLNSLSTFFGWGTKSVNTDPAFVYCGARSGKISGGSIDVHLTGGMKPNTKYHVVAKVWKVSGTIQVGVFGYDGTTADINNVIATADSWQDVDFTFTTGATLNPNGQGVFFNNGVGYIDNWGIYEVTTGIQNTIAGEVKLYPNPSSDYVVLKGISGSAKVVFVNIQGKTVKVVDNVTSGAEINLSDIAKGSYFVKVISKSGLSVKKLIVK